MDVRARSLHLFQDACGAVEGLGENLQLLCGEARVFGVDGLIDAGNDDGGVAGVLAGSVNRMPDTTGDWANRPVRAELFLFGAERD